MATVDPTIASRVSGDIMSQWDLGNLLGRALQLKQMQTEVQSQNVLRQLMAQPGAIDPKTGLPTSNTLAQFTKAFPQQGFKIADQISQAQERQAQTAHAQSETKHAEMQDAQQALEGSLSVYDEEMKSGEVDPKIAFTNLQTSLHDWVEEQPWDKERKEQNWKVLSGLSPAGLRAAAQRLSLSQAEREAQEKPQVMLTPSGEPIAVRPDMSTGGLDVRTASGRPYQGPVTKSSAGQPKMYQDEQGHTISYRNGQWRDETTQQDLEGPPTNLHTVTSGAARSAPAMALQVYMRTPAYQNAPDSEKPNLLAQFNAGFHNVQIGGTASAKADTSSLTNITKIADASEAFENTAMKNFDQALSLAPKGIKTNMGPLIERWVQDPAKALGDPGVPSYQAALLTAANEYAKVIAGSTGSQGSTVDSRREAAEMFSSLYNTDQIEGVIKVAKTDMDNKIASYSGQREGIKARLSGETGVGAGGAPSTAAPAGAGYHSAQDVVNAFHSGKLSRDAAAKILRDNGWAR